MDDEPEQEQREVMETLEPHFAQIAGICDDAFAWEDITPAQLPLQPRRRAQG